MSLEEAQFALCIDDVPSLSLSRRRMTDHESRPIPRLAFAGGCVHGSSASGNAGSLSERSESEAAMAMIELGMDGRPHCDTLGSQSMARGLKQCTKGCGRTFNVLTGTPLSRLYHKEHWLSFGTFMAEGKTVKVATERVAVTTAFRWHRRFLETAEESPASLKGIVEVDETCVLASRKGERKLELRRHGGKAAKFGLSPEQVPVLVDADRSGASVSKVLPETGADTLTEALGQVIDKDILLASDGRKDYLGSAASPGVRREALGLAVRKRVQEAFHIQTVNGRYSQLKRILFRYLRIATKYLDNYLRWFGFVVLEPCQVLATAMKRMPVLIERWKIAGSL